MFSFVENGVSGKFVILICLLQLLIPYNVKVYSFRNVQRVLYFFLYWKTVRKSFYSFVPSKKIIYRIKRKETSNKWLSYSWKEVQYDNFSILNLFWMKWLLADFVLTCNNWNLYYRPLISYYSMFSHLEEANANGLIFTGLRYSVQDSTYYKWR